MHAATRRHAVDSFGPVTLGGGSCKAGMLGEAGLGFGTSTTLTWNNQADRANDASRAAGAQQPVLASRDAAYNNMAAASFTGDISNPQNLLFTTLLDFPSTSTAFVIGSLPSSNANDPATSLMAKQYTCSFQTNASPNIAIFFDVFSVSSTAPSATAKVMEYVVRAANDCDIVINGSSQTLSNGTSYKANTQSYIGYGGGGSDAANDVKKMAVVLAFNATLSANVRKAIRYKLAAIYGIRGIA
jgi:hypothetical protein